MAVAPPLSPTRGAARGALHACVAAVLSLGAARLSAQQPVPTPPARPDSVAPADPLRVPADSARPRTGPTRARAAVTPRVGLEPPVSPRRAFLSSLLVPGLGQARLDRPSAGALFVTVELMAATLAAKSAYELRTAKAFRGDSLPVEIPLDSLGRPLPARQQTEGPFSNDLVRSRRLHLEDWLAVIAFNHLIAGAEAYVAANLWDLPTQVSARGTGRGPALVVSLAW